MPSIPAEEAVVIRYPGVLSFILDMFDQPEKYGAG